MADKGAQDQVRSNVEERASEKQGFFGKVKDSLNLTKHLGFVSDLDSPANQAALATMREKEETEGKPVVVPQAPLSDRLKEGASSVAQVAIGATTVASGSVAPRSETPLEEAQAQVEQAQLGGTVDHPDANLSRAVEGKEEGKEVSDGSPAKKSEHKSWVHLGRHKDKDPETGKEPQAEDPQAGKEPQAVKDDSSFLHWAGRTAKTLGSAVASKDLSDDLFSKKTKN